MTISDEHRKSLIENQLMSDMNIPEGAVVTKWQLVPHTAIWSSSGGNCLLPTQTMASAFWNEFSTRCKYFDGSMGYYESFGAAYKKMLDAALPAWNTRAPATQSITDELKTVESAINMIIRLKDHKTESGKTTFYENNKERAWDDLRAAHETLSRLIGGIK